MSKQLPLSPDQADAIALEALTFIANNEDMLNEFCHESGILLNDLRTRLGDRMVLGAILDFIFADNLRLKTFCIQLQYSGEMLVRARIALPGFLPEMRTVENF